MIDGTPCGVKIARRRDGTIAADLTRPLIVRDLVGNSLFEVATDGEWTLERIVQLLGEERACRSVSEAFGADAFIGPEWIGSTEV